MSRATLAALSAWLLGLAALLVGLYTVKEHFPEIPAGWWPICRFGVLLLTGSGIVFAILCLIAQPAGRLFTKATSLVTIDQVPFKFSPAAVEDLPRVRDLYVQAFGNEVPELARMMAWHARSPACFWIVEDLKDGQPPTLVGSFKILPLTKSGLLELVTGTASGTTFEPGHIAKHRSTTTAFYVGDLVAEGRRARAAVVNYVQGTIQGWRQLTLPIYARPLTERGLFTMTKFGFKSVPSGGQPSLGQLAVLR